MPHWALVALRQGLSANAALSHYDMLQGLLMRDLW